MINRTLLWCPIDIPSSELVKLEWLLACTYTITASFANLWTQAGPHGPSTSHTLPSASNLVSCIPPISFLVIFSIKDLRRAMRLLRIFAASCTSFLSHISLIEGLAMPWYVKMYSALEIPFTAIKQRNILNLRKPRKTEETSPYRIFPERYMCIGTYL